MTRSHIAAERYVRRLHNGNRGGGKICPVCGVPQGYEYYGGAPICMACRIAAGKRITSACDRCAHLEHCRTAVMDGLDLPCCPPLGDVLADMDRVSAFDGLRL